MPVCVSEVALALAFLHRLLSLPVGRAPSPAASVPGLSEPSSGRALKASQAALCSSSAAGILNYLNIGYKYNLIKKNTWKCKWSLKQLNFSNLTRNDALASNGKKAYCSQSQWLCLSRCQRRSSSAAENTKDGAFLILTILCNVWNSL